MLKMLLRFRNFEEFKVVIPTRFMSTASKTVRSDAMLQQSAVAL